MKKQRPLVPGFLQKFDNWLLLNRPDTWSARTHLVLWYSLLFSLTLAVVCWLAPQDFRLDSNVAVWTLFTALLCMIGLIVWVIFLVRFNLFKKFGRLKSGDRLGMFLLYLLSTAFIALPVFIPALVETARAKRVYSNEQMARDMNRMNLAICRINYDSLPRAWSVDTFIVRNVDSSLDDFANVEVDTEAVGRIDVRIIDSASFRRRRANADSVKTINDSTFLFCVSPDYNFVRISRDFDGVVSSGDLWRRALQQRPVSGLKEEEAELSALSQKYNPFYGRPYSGTYIESTSMERNYSMALAKKYDLYQINESLWAVSNKINRWSDSNLESTLHLYWYSILIATLLIFVFRHSTVRDFFLSLLAMVIISVIASLTSVFFRFSSSATCIMMLVIFLILFVAALTVSRQSVRRLASGIGLNLSVFTLSFVPLTAVALLFSILRDKEMLSGDNGNAQYWREMEVWLYLGAEIGGVILLLVLIPTLFHRLYRKWYSLPEQ